MWNWYSLTFPTLTIPVIWWNKKKLRTSRDPAIQNPPRTAEMGKFTLFDFWLVKKIGSVAYVELIFTDYLLHWLYL